MTAIDTISFNSSESAANQARTSELDIGSAKIAYRRFGEARGIPLVLLQRFRGTIDQWDPYFLNLLAAERELILFDSAGVGLSSGQVPESIAGMAELAARFLNRLGLVQFDVLGWSMGGCVAQQLALDQAKQVRRLILAATSPGGVADAPKMPDKVLQVMARPVNDDEDFLYLFFPETIEGRAEGLAHLKRLGQRSEPSAPAVKAESFKSQLLAIRSWSQGQGAALPRLSELALPVLVANGQFDVMIPAYNSFVLAQNAPDAHLILYPKSGHGFLFQHANEFSRRVNEFLRS